MNEENKRMKIALLTMSRDSHDRRSWRSWSGIVYHVAQALQKHCGEVSYGYLCKQTGVIAGTYRDNERYLELAQASRTAFETRLNWDVWGVPVKLILTQLLNLQA